MTSLVATGLVRRNPGRVRLPTASTWVNRDFLVDVINVYLAEPAARAAIGTPAGYEHLRHVLRVG